MYSIHFKGYFQCRLATDSAPFDDPTGNGGWTFAFAGEPPLDRIIRFQSPLAPRTHAPAVGVFVSDVNGDPLHALVGAEVELIENAVFEGRNGAIATAGTEPIFPFVFRIEKGTFRLIRRDDYVVTNPVSRKPHLGKGVSGLSPAEQNMLGVGDPALVRSTRAACLKADLVAETDPVKRLNLSQRLEQLESFNSDGDIQVFSMGFKVPYQHQLRHAVTVSDPQNVMPNADLTVPWGIDYWLGAWDADALQGYIDGTVEIPSAP